MRAFLCASIGAVMMALTTSLAGAAPAVTFYSDQASFLAAISPAATLDFEGIASDTGVKDLGFSYHTGSVKFSSSSVSAADVIVAGKQANALGAPYDSAILTSNSEPSKILATFDNGSGFTAVGGYLLSAFGMQGIGVSGNLTLSGPGGVLDSRSVSLGQATLGRTKTFYGYTVTGGTISSLLVDTPSSAPALDEFTYGTTVPEPTSLSLIFVGVTPFLMRLRIGNAGERTRTVGNGDGGPERIYWPADLSARSIQVSAEPGAIHIAAG
jgi:hypothetical protein